MNVLIVLAHPEPGSFNAALAHRARAALEADGHRVTMSDLYAENFNPVAGRHDFRHPTDPKQFHYQREQARAARDDSFAEDVSREQKRLQEADFLILQYPVWWGGVPAILKGWFDRVLAYGVAYVDGARYDSGRFHDRYALASITTGGTPERFRDIEQGGVYGPVERVLWQSQRLVLEYLGYMTAEPVVSYAAPRVPRDSCLPRPRGSGAASRVPRTSRRLFNASRGRRLIKP